MMPTPQTATHPARSLLDDRPRRDAGPGAPGLSGVVRLPECRLGPPAHRERRASDMDVNRFIAVARGHGPGASRREVLARLADEPRRDEPRRRGPREGRRTVIRSVSVTV